MTREQSAKSQSSGGSCLELMRESKSSKTQRVVGSWQDSVTLGREEEGRRRREGGGGREGGRRREGGREGGGRMEEGRERRRKIEEEEKGGEMRRLLVAAPYPTPQNAVTYQRA